MTGAEVDVWHATLRAGDDDLRRMRPLLAADELQRMAAFRTPVLRRRFLVARAFLRSVLAQGLGVPPTAVAFVAGPGGKPGLAGAPRRQFNLSHADERAVCAVTSDVALGVDLERIDPRIDCDDLLATCFAPREIDALLSVAPTQRQRAFFVAWTRKEAYVKALGTGLSTPLGSFAVAVGPEDQPRVVQHAPDALAGPWTMVDLTAPNGYVACLVAHAAEVRVRQREWAFTAPGAAPAAA